MAATYLPHLRLSYGGVLGNSVPEQWSNTLRWTVLGQPPSRDQLEAACDAVRSPLAAWFQRSDSGIHVQASLTWAKLNWILETGRQRDTETVQSDFAPPVGGSRQEPAPPYYQTFAVTFRTRVSRGRGHSGRVFPPMVVHLETNGTPYTTAASANAMASSYALLVRQARAAMGLIWQDSGVGVPILAVQSPGSSTAPVRGALQSEIIATVVDRVPDVQHRRTNRVPRSEGNTVLIDP